MKAINRGFFLSAAVSAAVVFAISRSTSTTGARRGGGHRADPRQRIQVLTQYFTDTKYKPVQEIAESTVTGPATTILSGFSTGLESTVWSALIIAGAIVGSFTWATRSPSGCTSSPSPAWGCSRPSGRSYRWTRTVPSG